MKDDDKGNDWFLTVTNFDKAEVLTTLLADGLLSEAASAT